MAISSAMVWEVRTTGTTNGGGGFKTGATGTDYSQQNSPQYTASDLASTNANTSTPLVTSATNFFGADCVGNIITILAATGWTAGRYEIVSVNGSGGATLDRACGTVATPSAAATYAVGGALNTYAIIGPAAGNKIWIKSGSYTFSTSSLITPNSTAATWTGTEGYNTTRGDAPVGTNRPLITITGSNTQNMGTFTYLKHVRFISLVASPVLGVSSNCFVENCAIWSQTGSCINASSTTTITNCQFYSFAGQGLGSGGSNVHLFGNTFISSSTGVIGQYSTLLNNLFIGCNNAIIISTSNNTLIMNNTVSGRSDKNLTTGINLSTTTNNRVTNNIITGYTTSITASGTGLTTSQVDYNDYYNNTNGTVFTEPHSISLDPQFIGLTELNGTTGTTNSTTSTLSDTNANFSSVVDYQDTLHIFSGSGWTADPKGYRYMITSHTSTSVTVWPPISFNNLTPDKVYTVITGMNAATGANVRNIGYPTTFPATNTAGSFNLGAAQTDAAQFFSTDPGTANVRNLTSYYINNVQKTGTLDLPATSDVKSGVVFDGGTKTGTFTGGASGKSSIS